MAEFKFALDKGEGKEYPAKFKGATFTFWTPEAPKDDKDWDAAFAALRDTHDDALSAYSTIAAGYNLNQQKEIKSLLNAEGATQESVQTTAIADAFRKIHRRLRGMGGSERKASGPRKVSEATANKIKQQGIEEMIADAKAAGDTVLEQALTSRLEKLRALGVSTPAANAAPAATDTPAAATPSKPKNGK